MMVRRRTSKQKQLEEWLEATYIIRRKVSKRDLGIICQSKYYPNSKKKDRNYNNGVEHTIQDLQQLSFMLIQLKPYYRSKILHSDQFKNVMEQVMDFGVSKFHHLTKEEKEKSLSFSVQMLSYCLKVIANNMPVEFVKPLVNHISPLNDLIKAIYANMKKNNKALPPFRDIALPIVENE